MRWQLKAATQKAISLLPQPQRLNYVLQRKVTRSLPASDTQFLLHFDEAVRHARDYERHGGRALEAARAYEFGAGWDLIGPLSLWALGVRSQVLVDIDALMRWELVNHTLEQLRRLRGDLEARAGRALRPVPQGPVGSKADLAGRFGIDYRAPLDARATGMPAGSFDLVSSTFTLEHIPAADVTPILAECARLLAPGGVVSCSVDLQDHYAFDDPRIGTHNFLRFSERTWRLVNSPLHHQNRLRARDYVAAFEAAGLEILATEVTEPSPQARARLEALDVHESFRRRYSPDELAPVSIEIVARRR